MIGLILCGGKSLRMGNDKGMLKLEAKTWAQTAVDKVAELGFPIKISINKQQYDAYAEAFMPAQLIVDDDTLSFRGPLQAVLSVHKAFPNEDLLVMATDMPLMETKMLKILYESYQSTPGADAHVFTYDGEAEPLCGIYTAQGLATVMIMHHQGMLVKHSMKFMLEHIAVNYIALTEDQKKYFRNFNAHSELNGL